MQQISRNVDQCGACKHHIAPSATGAGAISSTFTTPAAAPPVIVTPLPALSIGAMLMLATMMFWTWRRYLLALVGDC